MNLLVLLVMVLTIFMAGFLAGLSALIFYVALERDNLKGD